MTDTTNIPMEEEFDNVVWMTDEDGNEVGFEFLDLIEYAEAEYVVLYPVDDSENPGEVVILKIVQESDDEETYAGIEDEAELAAVFGIFVERHKDEIDFADEGEDE